METKAVLNAVPPYGHVIATEKWRNSPLIQSLKGRVELLLTSITDRGEDFYGSDGGGVRILFEDELGVADFHLPNKSCVLYVSECDLVAGNGYKRKLVRYRNTSSHGFQELVLVEKTRLGEQYFGAVQKLVVLDLGLTLLPVGGQAEASQLIVQIVHGVGRENPFRRRTSSRLLDPLVLALVQHVPGVGRVKALALLERFSSIHQLCNAAPAQLEPIVGQAAAQQVHGFFHNPPGAGT